MSKIILYKGKRGSGKTLTMVKDGYTYFNRGWRVLRNFKCPFGEYISEEGILALDKNSKIENCVIMMDEVQIFFDSRRFAKKENISFSNFVQQIRKRNIILLCTTQFSNTIDLRLRQHIDIVAYPTFKEKYPVCEVVYVDVTSIEDNLYGAVSNPKFFKVVYNPIPIFKLYNTSEMIK